MGATRPRWPLLRKDHFLNLPEGISVRFLDAFLCPCWWRLVLPGETRPNLAGWCNGCANLLHVLRHVLAQILPGRHPDPRSSAGGSCTRTTSSTSTILV